jgi:hypothetical protein
MMMNRTTTNHEDLDVMTSFWHRETNDLNIKVDEAFRKAQDHAYALGVARGKSEAALSAGAAMRDAANVITELFQQYGLPTPDATLERLTSAWK